MSAQADEDEAFRQGLNARIRVELETALRLVKASGMSAGEQADMMAGMAAYMFGAAAAARRDANPGESPQQCTDALTDYISTGMRRLTHH